MKKETELLHRGRDPQSHHGVVNPPVYRVSTVLFPTVQALEMATARPFEGVYYGRIGTPTTQAFEEAVAALEGAYRAVATSSGLAAITIALLAFLRAGDHCLIADSVYGPTRKFCDATLTRLGIEVTYYDPLVGGNIAALLRDNTRVVYLESPGSLTFEIQDVPAITQAAHARGIKVLMDNTWATPLYFNALQHGVDVSIHAATKYIAGHADAMLGVINCSQACYADIKSMAVQLGNCPGSEECFLGLRGLRTLAVRLKQQEKTALHLAQWLAARPEVERILYPALPTDPGHRLWQRDFHGASGLFGAVLKPTSKAALAAMLDGMTLFKMGYSWGGYESLILPTHPAQSRTATRWQTAGPCLRLHAGLEAAEDLIADLESGFARLRNAPHS